MPSSWRLHLRDAPETPLDPTWLHAVVSGWLDDEHKAPVKRFALGRPDRTGDGIDIQIRLLDDSLADRLQSLARPGTAVRLGSHRLSVGRRPHLIAATRWEDLLQDTTERSWWVTVTSPATFRRGNRTTPWPAPESLVAGLVHRWQHLHPPTSPVVQGLLAPTAGRELWVSDFDGHSSHFRLRDTLVSAFVGRVCYACDNDARQPAAFEALLRFAAYAGIGSHTAFGLGTIRLSPGHHRRNSNGREKAPDEVGARTPTEDRLPAEDARADTLG